MILLKVIKQTFSNTTCGDVIRFPFTIQFRNFDGIKNQGTEVDLGPLRFAAKVTQINKRLNGKVLIKF